MNPIADADADAADGPRIPHPPPDDPLDLFDAWFQEAERSGAVAMPSAMTLATASADGRPSARVVLLKEASAAGFVFYTNYESPKARDLDENPRAELVFYWGPTGRHVRVAGAVRKVDASASDEYFATRPRGSQVGAWASEQSRPLDSFEALAEAARVRAEEFEGRDVPRPSHWGGFVLAPERCEFWTYRDDRLHHRICYERGENGGWTQSILAP